MNIISHNRTIRSAKTLKLREICALRVSRRVSSGLAIGDEKGNFNERPEGNFTEKTNFRLFLVHLRKKIDEN